MWLICEGVQLHGSSLLVILFPIFSLLTGSRDEFLVAADHQSLILVSLGLCVCTATHSELQKQSQYLFLEKNTAEYYNSEIVD